MSSVLTPRFRALRWPAIYLAAACVILLGVYHLGGPGLDLGDFSEVFGRHRRFLRATLLHDGVVPLWNPYNFSGHPFVGDLLVAPFYPTLALYLVLPERLALFLDVALHMAAGGVGMRALARRLGVAEVGAAAAGLFYLTLPSWFGHTWAGHLPHVQSLAWIPWLYWTAEAAMAGSLRRAWLPGILSTAALTGCGGVPIAWMSVLFLPGWIGLRLLGELPGGPSPMAVLGAALRRALPRALGLATALALGLALSAANWLPAMLYTRECGRSSSTLEWVAQDALSPLGLLAAAIPELLPRAATMRYVIFEWYGYPGALVLVAAVLALILARPPRGRGAALALALVAAVLASGPTLGLTALLSVTVPGYGLLRCHCRELTLTLFFLLPLAGSGIQALWERAAGQGGPRGRTALLVSAGVLCVLAVSRIVTGATTDSGAELTPWLGIALGMGLAMLALRPHPSMLSLLLALHVLDIVAPARGLRRFAELDLWRFTTLAGADATLRDDLQWYRYWAHEEVINANHGIDLQRRSITGYENQFPVRYGRYISRFAGLEPDKATTHLSPGLVELVDDPFRLELLGLRYAILPAREPGERPPRLLGHADGQDRPPGPPPPGLDAPGDGQQRATWLDPGAISESAASSPTRPVGWTVLTNEHPLPRAVLVQAWDLQPTPEQALEAVFEPGFAPRSRVVLEREPRWPALPPQAESDQGSRVISTVDRGPNRIEIQVAAAEPSLLVLSELYHPGWYAEVDGLEVPVLRADYLLRAVAVPAGQHSVTMHYMPPGLVPGLLLSLMALLSAGLVPRLRFLPGLTPPPGATT